MANECKKNMYKKVIKKIQITKEVLYKFKPDFNLLALREECPNTELFLVRIFLYLDLIRRFTP